MMTRTCWRQLSPSLSAALKNKSHLDLKPIDVFASAEIRIWSISQNWTMSINSLSRSFPCLTQDLSCSTAANKNSNSSINTCNRWPEFFNSAIFIFICRCRFFIFAPLNFWIWKFAKVRLQCNSALCGKRTCTINSRVTSNTCCYYHFSFHYF